MDTGRAADFLRAHHRAVLATSRSDGRPQLSPVTCTVDGQNRVLIRQELSFLDHLMRVLSGTPEGAYSAGGSSSPRVQVLNLIDMRV